MCTAQGQGAAGSVKKSVISAGRKATRGEHFKWHEKKHGSMELRGVSEEKQAALSGCSSGT